MGSFFDLPDNETDEAITDDDYRVAQGDSPGKDRGIDAVYIDESKSPPTVHLLNCKYAVKLEKTESFFPSSELDKILTFLGQLMAQDSDLMRDINVALRAKATEILDHFAKTNPNFVLHFASNCTEGLANEEELRLKNALKAYSNLRWTPSFRPLGAEIKMDFRGLLSSVFVCVVSVCASKNFRKERTSRD